MAEQMTVDVFVESVSVDALDVSGPDGHAYISGYTRVGGRVVGGEFHGALVYRRFTSAAAAAEAGELGKMARWDVEARDGAPTPRRELVAL